MIEDKRNELNLQIRGVLSIIDLIDGYHREYEDYIPNTLDEEAYLDQQLKLVLEAKQRLINIFKE